METSALTGLELVEQVLGDVAGEVDLAVLPAGAGQDGFDSGLQLGVGVADDQRNPLGMLGAGGVEAALAKAPEELGPQIGRLGVADGHAEDLSTAQGGHADCDDDGLGGDMAVVSDVEVGGVEVEVGEAGVVQRGGS